DGVHVRLLGGVDAQLAPEAVADGRVIEIVRRPVHDEKVARRIDIARGPPGHFREVVDVDVLGDHDDVLGQHHEPEPPERVHDLARLPGIALPDRDDDQVVEDALGGHVHVDYFGQEQTDDG